MSASRTAPTRSPPRSSRCSAIRHAACSSSARRASSWSRVTTGRQWPANWKKHWSLPRANARPRHRASVRGTRAMRVSVFGLGYVGSVSAANFAADGHEVVGVDVHAEKVRAINEGRSPIVEPGLGALLEQGAAAGRLRATTSTGEAVRDTELSLICVGTPSRKNGSLDLSYLVRVCEQIGDAIRNKPDYHVVVVRSTVLPGTTH